MFTKAERLISFRNLKPKKKEGFLKVISVFSFLGIMIGVAILIIVMSVMNGFRADLTEKILGLNPHIVVSSNGYFIDEEFKSNLKRKFKNFNFAKSYGNEGIILAKDYTKGILIKGIDSKNLDNFIFLKKKLAKGNIKNFKIGSALIGRELAYNLNLKIGDDISLMSSTFVKTPLGGFPLQEKFKIAGIFNSGFFEYDQNVVFLDLEDSLSLFDKTNKDINLEIYIDKPIEADIYKKEISQINENFYVYSWTDINKSFFSALKVERNVMFIILTLIIIVAAFNIISGLTILIKNKTREIAILKTLGLSNKSIKKSFFLTGLTIGFFASISGVILGSVFSIYIEEIRIFLSQVFDLNIFPSDVYFLDELPSELNLKSTLLIFIFSLLITAIASYFPASSISKMETIKGLKYD